MTSRWRRPRDCWPCCTNRSGYACTHSEEEGPNIYELLPAHWPERNPAVTSVGRLDKDTSGLLLVTDIGSLVHRFTSPKSDIEKTYLVEVDRDLDAALIEIFAKGDLMLRSEAKPCLPAKLEIVSDRKPRASRSPKAATIRCAACSPARAGMWRSCTANALARMNWVIWPRASGGCFRWNKPRSKNVDGSHENAAHSSHAGSHIHGDGGPAEHPARACR
jgi:pseudouridine synthase